jgi:Domain of unknown function (DUF4398)
VKARGAMWIGCAVLLIGAGCASTAPVQLTSARGAYRRAEAGPAARFATAELREAKGALDVAERSFRDRGDAPRTRDLAYVARRRAQLAALIGDAVAARMAREPAAISRQAQEATSVEHTTGRLERSP